MKKSSLLVFGLALVFISALAFGSGDNDDQQKANKKMRVKMVKNVDGKITCLDTILIDFKPGDHDKLSRTFMGACDGKADSLFKTMFVELGIDDKEPHKRKVKVYAHGVSSGDMNIEEMIQGDSLLHTICINTNDKDNDREKKVVIWKSKDGEETQLDQLNIIRAPMPPLPPAMGFKSSRHVIELDDPSIISFKKKDLGGDKEKIEIIRRKPEMKAKPENN